MRLIKSLVLQVFEIETYLFFKHSVFRFIDFQFCANDWRKYPFFCFSQKKDTSESVLKRPNKKNKINPNLMRLFYAYHKLKTQKNPTRINRIGFFNWF